MSSQAQQRRSAIESRATAEPANLQVCVILAFGLLFSLGVARHWRPLNGWFRFTEWIWPWRDLGLLRTAALLLPPFVVIAGVLWRAEKDKSPACPWKSLGLLALANYLLQMLGMLADPRGIGLVEQIVSSPRATSYFTDAMAIQQPLAWLADFHHALLALHSSTHPPGPILFYYVFYQLLGPTAGALTGGCAVGLLGSIGVMVMYAFAGLWTADRRARITPAPFTRCCRRSRCSFPNSIRSIRFSPCC